MRLIRALLAALVAVTLGACGSLPRDPNGTLERVQAQGVLRVGASPAHGLVVIDGNGDANDNSNGESDDNSSGESVGGREAELAEGFAQEVGAEVRWVPGGESELVAAMERGELDLIIGGLHDDSGWAEQISLTRPYSESTEADGTTVRHVLAVPLGENAMLVRLERYLDEADR